MHLLHRLREDPECMSNGTPELCESWNLLGKLVNRRVPKPRVVVRLSWFKRQEHRVLVVASMGLEKPHPTVASHTSLSMFNLVSLISYHHVLPSYYILCSGYIIWMNQH